MRYGVRVMGDGLVLRYKKTTGLPRFAFVVSVKIDKRATQRNRMRRILSESVRHLLPRLAGGDGIFVVRKNIAKLSQREAEAMVTGILTHANFL